MIDEDDDPFGVRSVAVSTVVGSALFAALIRKLGEKGILTDTDTRELYDDALHSLERQQADAEPDVAEMYRKAREVIETPLRGM